MSLTCSAPACSDDCRILVVDDHPLIGELVADAASKLGFAQQTLHTETLALARKLLATFLPTLIILDLGLPDGEGWDLVIFLASLRIQPRVLILSARLDEETLLRAAQVPIHGFLDKGSARLNILVEAITHLKAGRTYFSPTFRTSFDRLRRDSTSWTKFLTQTELELLPLFTAGLDDKSISTRVSRSPFTVHSHRKHIMKKVGVNSSAELIHWAGSRGIVRFKT